MYNSRSSPQMAIRYTLIATLTLLIACSNSSDPTSTNQQLQQQLEQTQKEVEHKEAELHQTQRQLSEAQQQADSAVQISSFLKGALISGIIMALIIGIGLGSKARQDSLKKKEDDMHDTLE